VLGKKKGVRKKEKAVIGTTVAGKKVGTPYSQGRGREKSHSKKGGGRRKKKKKEGGTGSEWVEISCIVEGSNFSILSLLNAWGEGKGRKGRGERKGETQEKLFEIERCEQTLCFFRGRKKKKRKRVTGGMVEERSGKAPHVAEPP